MKVTVRFEGGQQTAQALEAFKTSTAKGIVRRALATAAKPFDEHWRAHVGEASGTLKKSGGIGSKLSRSQAKVKERNANIEVFAGPGPLVQAIQDEFGNEHQAPNPAVRGAWDATSAEMPETVGRELWVQMEKTARRQANKAAKLAAKLKG